MRRWLILATVLLFATASAAASAGAPELLTYVDDGVRLKVPKGWTVIPGRTRWVAVHGEASLVFTWSKDSETEGAILLGKELGRMGVAVPESATRTVSAHFNHYRFDIGGSKRLIATGLVSRTGRTRFMVLLLAPLPTFDSLGGDELLHAAARGSGLVSHAVGSSFIEPTKMAPLVPRVHAGWSLAVPNGWVFREAGSSHVTAEHPRGGLTAPGFAFTMLDAKKELSPVLIAQEVLGRLGASEIVVLRRDDEDVFTTHPRQIFNEHWVEARVVAEGKTLYVGIIARGNRAAPCYAMLSGDFEETRKVGGFPLLRSMFLSVGPAPKKPIELVGAWEYGNTSALLHHYEFDGTWTRSSSSSSAVLILFHENGWYEMLVYFANDYNRDIRMLEHEQGRYIMAGSVLLMQPGRSRTQYYDDGEVSNKESRGGPLYVRFVRQRSDGSIVLIGPGIQGPSRSEWSDAEEVVFRRSDLKKPLRHFGK